jgi:hypothetical protein
MNSLKRLVWLAFIVVSSLLVAISLLGVQQHRLAKDYNRVISQNERALFHYMTIRETITENLITGNWIQLDSVVGDIEKLNGELNRLKENKLISAQLKFAFADKIDLTGLAILLHQVSQASAADDRSRQLQQQLRTISDYLIQYDRIVASEARQRIVNFQTVVIGALGLIISLASVSLILLYRNTVAPLLLLSKMAREETLHGGSFNLGRPVVQEIEDLIEGMESLARTGRTEDTALSDESSREAARFLGEAVNETTNRLNGIINYAQLLHDNLENIEQTEEQRQMLQKIIESGASIAKEWQKIK